MKKLWILLMLSSVVLSAENYSDWSKSAILCFNTTDTGANVQGDVTGFPVLVRLGAGNFTFSQAKSNGEDIRFADQDGSHLAYEIEEWDSANAIAKVNVLSRGMECVLSVDKESDIRLEVYSVSGRKQWSCSREIRNPGFYRIPWNFGEGSGIYTVILKRDDKQVVRRFMVMR